ncbi:MAG: histidine phosphatase family protein [Candidatus Binatia bacterium]
MTTLVLLRHGVTDWNEQGRLLGWAEIPLNERGRAQAAAAAAALRELPVAAIVASPQRRAQETATIVAAALGLAVETEADLAEVWVGHWQGQTAAQLAEHADVWRYFADPLHRCDAIEPTEEVAARVVAAGERLRARFGDRHVCLVSHGDPIRLLLAHCLGLPLAGFRRLHVDPGSISIATADGARVINWRPQSL